MMTMTINSLVMRLRLMAPTAKPIHPVQNTFKQFAVNYDADGLYYLQLIVDEEIKKHLHDFQDKFCGKYRIQELMWMDSLIPDDIQSTVILSGPEKAYLLAYLTDRMLMMTRFQESILTRVPMADLHKALHNLRATIMNGTQIINLKLPNGH